MNTTPVAAPPAITKNTNVNIGLVIVLVGAMWWNWNMMSTMDTNIQLVQKDVTYIGKTVDDMNKNTLAEINSLRGEMTALRSRVLVLEK